MRINESRGFTVIELMVSIAVIGIISGGVYLRNIRNTRDYASEETCRYSRNVIVRAEQNYFIRNQSHSNSFQDLADAGLIRQVPECPSGGVYAWLSPEDSSDILRSQVVCSVHGGYSEKPPVISDKVVEIDFSDGTDDGWTRIGSNWEVSDGKYYGGPNGEHRSFYGNDNWTDYDIQVDAALLAGTPPAAGYGIYFRASGFEDRDTLNAYVFQYDSGFAGGEFVLRKVENGRERAPLVRIPPPDGYNWLGEEKTLRIEVRGDTFTAYISDINGGNTPVLTASNSDFSAGAIGFRTWSDSKASFGNLIIELKD